MADVPLEIEGYDDAADEVVYFPNVTHALNVVARSLPLTEGDEILTTDHEYGALDRTWGFVCGKTGARYVVRTLPDPLDDPNEVVEAIMDGVWTVIDGAHAPGQVPVQLHEMGVDFYDGNCHKWLSAPKGSGFLYARREVQQECHALARWARARIGELTDLPHVTADSPDWYGQMVTLPLPPGDPAELKRRLYDEYGIEVPVGPWRERRRIRISVQGYNTRADVERLVGALEALITADATPR
jgi:selenocysteine lyase/cysteine desulfurase